MSRRNLTNACAILTLATLSACQKQQAGSVYVSQPEIFTRESLVQERATEVQYLKAKLALPDPPFGFQGTQSTSVSQSFTNSLGIQYGISTASGSTPAKGSSNTTTGNGTVSSSSTPTPAGTSSITINNTNNGSQSPTGTSSTASGNSTSGATGTGSSSSTQGQASTSSTSSGGNGGSASTASGSAPSPATQPMPTESPMDVLSDSLAYRDAINAAIKEKMLDDTHDLRGYTLYTLKFDLAVMPGKPESSSRPLVVLMELDDHPWNDGGENSPQSAYLNWIQNLNHEIQIETEIA
jgi:hypothetical protein